MLGSADHTDANLEPLLTLSTQQVPEPAAPSIFGSAAIAFCVRRRRANV